MTAVTAATGERDGRYGTKAADTSRARPARRPGFVVGGPSTTLRNVANGPSTTLLRSQRPVHHVGERGQRAIDLPGIREAPCIWGVQHLGHSTCVASRTGRSFHGVPGRQFPAGNRGPNPTGYSTFPLLQSIGHSYRGTPPECDIYGCPMRIECRGGSLWTRNLRHLRPRQRRR
jgi:hypothetical protein